MFTKAKFSVDLDLFGEKPLEYFYPALAHIEEVRNAIRQSFNSSADKILEKLEKGEPLEESEWGAEDIIVDLIWNESRFPVTMIGLRSHGPFPIVIRQYGPVFIVTSMEFDAMGYFESLEDAKWAIELNFGPYLTSFCV